MDSGERVGGAKRPRGVFGAIHYEAALPATRHRRLFSLRIAERKSAVCRRHRREDRAYDNSPVIHKIYSLLYHHDQNVVNKTKSLCGCNEFIVVDHDAIISLEIVIISFNDNFE